jgi:eukaryotic-like serine/threonine-protein kinase
MLISPRETRVFLLWMPSTDQIASRALIAGRYRVLDRLGSGGMAVVLLAEDTVLGRQVAVKRLLAAPESDHARRFEREARLGAHLNHPNIVSVFDTLADEDGVLIVMEFVPGRPLSELIESGPLRPRDVVAIGRSVAGALDHAHAHGVVHRDVKPANVLLRDDGVVKLADLGVATGGGSTQITGTGDVVGTLAYIAPERFKGEPATPAADIYSLAAVSFEALSGQRAQRGQTPAEILELAETERPPDLRDVWADAPPAAAAVLKRGLDSDPKIRPKTASALIGELEKAVAGPGGVDGAGTARVHPAADDRVAALMGRRSTRPTRGMVAAILAGLAALAAGAIVLGAVDGGSEPPAARNADRASAGSKAAGGGESAGTGDASAPSAGIAEGDVPAAPAASSAGNAEGSAPDDPALGSQLNDQGYALIQQGRYEEAVPILQRAVGSFPDGTSDLSYAYALYNLGHALRLSGRADEAVPILEQRLQIPDQTATVRQELQAARAEATE